jgi:hypothetical protein
MNNISLTAILAFLSTFSDSAYSQTVIDITGSTSARSAVHIAILSTLYSQNRTYAWSGGANAEGATRAIYKGNCNGNSFIIRTYWAGSAAGVRDVSNKNQLSSAFLSTNTFTSSYGSYISPSQLNSNLAATSAQTVPEIAISDVFQSSTAFTTNMFPHEDTVAVIPFKFFKNDGASAALTNVTPGLYRSLYGATGELPLFMFTGNSADTTTVFSTGRDEYSGARTTCLAETGAGVFSVLNQYVQDPSVTIASPPNDFATLNFVGNGGYNSGDGVAKLLAAKYSNGIILGYLGISDWAAATNGGATELAYNGITLGTNNDLIRNGAYSLWGYVHQSHMGLTNESLDFYNTLKDILQNYAGTGLILNTTMNVERASDGAPITPL